jgi:hypothetical protein
VIASILGIYPLPLCRNLNDALLLLLDTIITIISSKKKVCVQRRSSRMWTVTSVVLKKNSLDESTERTRRGIGMNW